MRLTDHTPVERATHFLAELDVASIELLIGDASNRVYLRAVLGGGVARIVALLPEPFLEAELPFVNVARFLADVPIRVPEILRVSGPEGALLLEDLGDAMLQDVVERSDEAAKVGLYEKAIDILVRLQRRGAELESAELESAELESDRYAPYRVSFDAAKFEWELDFFRRHFLEGLAGAALSDEDQNELSSIFRGLAAGLCEHEFVVCHRDYHARNLMVLADEKSRDVELALIDFQDARLGPRAYDVVSLLNDSYVLHSAELVAAMIERFEQGVGASITNDYDPVALQRNLKALGTFGYQIAGRGNDVYERYVEGTLSLVRANLERNPDRPNWETLRRILARHCEEIS